MAGNEELDPPFWKVPLFFVDQSPTLERGRGLRAIGPGDLEVRAGG